MTSTGQRVSFFQPKPHNPCTYCGSTSYGEGCKISPSGRHYHPHDPHSCRFCGAKGRGRGCRFNPPTGLHVLGMGSQNCVYCGSPSKGRGCQLNPIGIHDPVGSEITPLPQDPRRNSSSGNTSEQHLDNDSDSGGQSNYDPATQETLDRAGGSMRERCALLLKNPQHIALQIGGGFLLAGCCIWFVWHATPDPTWRLVGSTLSIVLGYFFRNVLAVVLGRSWFGLPAVLAGFGVRHFIDVDAGNILILGSLALWIWPVWPFAVLLLLAFAAAAPALSRAGGAKLYGGK